MRGIVVIMLSIPGIVTGYWTSTVLFPIIYSDRASSFARLRGGPAVGIGLILALFLPKRAALREEAGGVSPSLLDMFAFLWSLCEIAAGVLLADFVRGARRGE